MNTKRNRFPLVMKSTALISGIVTGALTVLYHFCPQDWIYSAAISFGTVCYHFTMRLLVGAIVPPLVTARAYTHRWFQPRSWERVLYKRLKVKGWKQGLPTYAPQQFDLAQNTLEQVIQNTCGAELVHEVIMMCSFIPLLFAIPFGAFPVFLTTSVLAALYDSIFVIAQRYNRPRLVRILEKKEAKAP